MGFVDDILEGLGTVKLYTIRFCTMLLLLPLGACGVTTTDLGCIWFKKTHWTDTQINQTTDADATGQRHIKVEWRPKYEQDAANNQSYDQHCLNK